MHLEYQSLVALWNPINMQQKWEYELEGFWHEDMR